jgi:hypothetical protein
MRSHGELMPHAPERDLPTASIVKGRTTNDGNTDAAFGAGVAAFGSSMHYGSKSGTK